MRDRFLRDLVASASVDRARPGARQRALARLGLEAPCATWPRGMAGAVLATALALVFCAGVRARSFGAAITVPALSTRSLTPECAGALEAPPGPCDEGSPAAIAAIATGSSSGGTALGSSGS